MLKILIVEDNELNRDMLSRRLERRGYAVVWAGNGPDGLAAARREQPNLVLMDLTMPGMGGLEATTIIKAEMPDMKVVILTVSDTDADLFEAIRSGAHGYLVKSTSSTEFFELLAAVERGEAPLSRGLASKIMQYLASGKSEHEAATGLTPREEEILRLVAEGKPNREVAEELFISSATVKFHMTNILNKLHLQNRAQVVAFAHRHGLANPPEDTALGEGRRET